MARSGRRSLPLLVPLAVVLAVIAAALLAPVLTPFDPTDQHLTMRLRPPRWMAGGDARFLLGTDHLGRDILSRLLYGARVSLPIAFAAATVGGIVGISLGLLSGYYRGSVDSVVTKLIDIQLSFPFILFAIAVMAVTGPKLWVLVLVLAARSWTTFARIVRGETFTISGNEYVLAARALGATHARVIGRHITPNILPLAAVIGTLDIGALIILESTLSFLGLGIQPPLADWGGMVRDNAQAINFGGLAPLIPAAAIAQLTIGVNLVVDWYLSIHNQPHGLTA
jgi:peptide/nickel transport system permease protein